MSKENYLMPVRNTRRMKELGFDETKDLLDSYEKLKAENEELKEKLELIKKVSIPNSQGNSIVPTDLIFGKEQQDDE